MAQTIRIRRGLRADLDLLGPLYSGELGFCIDTKEVFVGDGKTNHLVGKVNIGTEEDKPSPGTLGRLFYAEDTHYLYVDVGAAWFPVGVASLPWERITGKPELFPPSEHNHDELYEPRNPNIQAHISDTNNPHNVTKEDVGLGNVDNTSDMDKPISRAMQEALDLKADIEDLAPVATTGDYNDLINTPEPYQHPVTHPASMITGLASVATSGDYNDLKNTPEPYEHPETHPASMITGLAQVAITGNYNDLVNAPEPYKHPATHPASMITGLAPVATSGSYKDLTDKPTSLPPGPHDHDERYYTQDEVDTLIEQNRYTHPETHPASIITGLATVATSGRYQDLTGIPSTFPPSAHNHDSLYEPKNSNIQAHISSKSNPHGVTKAQVGLGNVQDYGIATQTEAQAGTSNTKYMTPLRVRQAIESYTGVLDGGSFKR